MTEFLSTDARRVLILRNPNAGARDSRLCVDRLAELCVAANSDPKVKEVLATFVLDPALGFKESNALYQRELPTWIESAQALGLDPA
jgi:hypothetical protein